MVAVYQQPFVHRLARRWALSGVRGAALFWRLADRLADWPAGDLVAVWPGVIVPVVRKDYVAAAFYRGTYERPEFRLLRALLRGPDPRLIIDVGANVGIYTSLFSVLAGPGGRVLAFEPAPSTFAVLQRLVEGGGLSNVDARPVAVGRGPGTARLRDLGGATNSGLASMRDQEDGGVGVAVAVVSIGDLDEVAGREIDLIKVDVEGLEADVLAGALSLFEAGLVRFAMVEVSPHFGNTPLLSAYFTPMTNRYALVAVSEVGRFVRRPALREIAPTDIEKAATQYNLLVARRDLIDQVPGWFDRR